MPNNAINPNANLFILFKKKSLKCEPDVAKSWIYASVYETRIACGGPAKSHHANQ